MLTAATEAALRGHGPAYRKLDEDLKNCFSEMCRVGVQEDILDSEKLLGCDFSMLAAYFQMAYVEVDGGGWFWMDVVNGKSAHWEYIPGEEGIRQGAPLSCFLCGLALKRAQIAAERAMDVCGGHDRHAGSTDQEKAAAFKSAAAEVTVAGYLDDTALQAPLTALGRGHVAYHAECLKKNGQTVPKKLVLSGRWYAERAQSTDGEQSMGQGAREQQESSPASTMRLSPIVELLPGVCINRAIDGQIWLGKPFGTAEFVQAELQRQQLEQLERLEGIVEYSKCDAAAVCHNAVALSKQLALAAIKYSANSRDIHFLRAMGARVIAEAAARHDNAVDHAVAEVLGQATVTGVEQKRLHERDRTHVTHAFHCVKDWIRLQGDMGIRPWRRYGDAAHVAMWAQAYNSSQIQIGAMQVCAFPWVSEVIDHAETLADVEPTIEPREEAEAQSWDLLQAWKRLVRDTERAYVEVTTAVDATGPAHWLALTGKRVGNVGALPERAQKILSAGLRLNERFDVRERLRMDTTIGSGNRLQLFEASRAAGTGLYWQAQPWMDDGDLHWGNTELCVGAALRYGLDLQRAVVPRQRCPCGWHGVDAAGGTRSERDVTASAYHEWARHAVASCSKGAGVRTRVHDGIVEVVMAMLQNAGFEDVKLEDRDWDAAAGYADVDHKRPDVTCLHPVTRVKLVLDVVIWWGATKGVERSYGLAATQREQWKRARYQRAMLARQVEQAADGNSVGGVGGRTERFVPLGFEAGGAFGSSTVNFLRELEEAAAGQSSSDLYHWSGSEWRSHWRQRLSLRLVTGQAAVLLGAVESARANARGKSVQGCKASLEWTATGSCPGVV
eukprot:SAG31_NODE_3752_length_3920_cov_27.390997_1_plen_841_part_00